MPNERHGNAEEEDRRKKTERRYKIKKKTEQEEGRSRRQALQALQRTVDDDCSGNVDCQWNVYTAIYY